MYKTYYREGCLECGDECGYEGWVEYHSELPQIYVYQCEKCGYRIEGADKDECISQMLHEFITAGKYKKRVE